MRAVEPVPSHLRAAAAQRNAIVGTAVGAGALGADISYRPVVAREFNSLTPENEMKWDRLRPSRTTFNFAEADAIVAYA